jgi:hypothetical protein
MKLTVSFDGDERTYEPIPAGKYEAKVNNIEEKTPTLLNIRFTIEGGQFDKRSLFTNCTLTPEAKWKFQNLLIAAGLWQSNTKGDWAGDTNDLVGRKVGLSVIEGEYNGNKRPEVKSIFRIGSAPEAAPVASAAPAATGSAPVPPPAPAGKRL